MASEIEIALGNLRERIDDIDTSLLDLLNQRALVVEEVGRIKKEHNLPIYQPHREEQVYAHVTAQSKGPLPPEAIRQVFEGIVDQMRKIQRTGAERPKDGEPMLVVMEQGVNEAQIEKTIGRLMEGGFDVHRSTSAACPTCSAPIVGTKPILLPASPARRCCHAATVSQTRGFIRSSPRRRGTRPISPPHRSGSPLRQCIAPRPRIAAQISA